MADEEVLITAPAWQRSIGDIVPMVVVREESTDELMITEHPVEQGAAVTDHAYNRPARVTIIAGWTNSSEMSGGDEGFVQQMYEDMLALKQSRQLIQVTTGKRRYQDMLIEGLSMTTDEKTETALFITAYCRQLIIVETQVSAVPPPSVQSDPSKTSAISSGGTKQLQPAPNFNTGPN